MDFSNTGCSLKSENKGLNKVQGKLVAVKILTKIVTLLWPWDQVNKMVIDDL